MASYKDAITQFSPYVQQLPVELMMKVGAYKQQQYDQGVQKIQSYIDNVAGLEAPRPQDKAYLESKLNSLGDDLKIVAAGDFSNQQLVSSVGGMASQIIKDPYIQSAVYSAAQIKKNNQKMEEAEKKGLLKPENKDFYDKQLQTYMNGKLGDQFNGKYIPYVDVMEHLRKVAKDTGIDENVIPELFETDSNGKTIMQRDPATGQISPKINKVMAERHIKGKTAEKLLLAFKNSLTPEVKQQLAITGIYENKNLTPEQLAITTNASFTGHIKQLETDIARLDMAIDFASNSEYDPEKLQVLQAAKQDSTDALSAIEKQRSEVTNLDYVAKNADSIRANLYSTNFLQGTANQMKEVSDITDYKVNPWFQVMDIDRKFALDLQRETREREQFNTLRKEHAADKEAEFQKWRFEYKGKYGQYPEEVGVNQKKIKGPLDLNDPEAIKNSYESGYQEDVEKQSVTARELAIKWVKRNNPNLSDEQVLKSIEKWSGGDDKSYEAMIDRFAGRLITQFNENPASVDGDYHGLIRDFIKTNDAVSAKGARIKNTLDKAKALVAAEGEDVSEYTNVLSKVSDVKLPLPGGMTALIPKQDIVEFAKLIPKQFNVFGGFTVDASQKANAALAERKLRAKYGERYDIIKDGLVREREGLFGLASSITAHPEVTKAGNLLANSINTKISQAVGKLYAAAGYMKAPYIEPVKQGTDNAATIAQNRAAILEKYSSGVNEDSSFNSDQYNTVANGANAKTVFEISDIDGKAKYKMITTSEKGRASVIVDAEDYTLMTGNPEYNLTPTPEVILKLNEDGTTAKSPGVPWFNSDKFIHLKGTKYNKVSGNLISDKSNPSSVWFELYNVPGSNGKKVLYPDPISFPQGLPKYLPGGQLNPVLENAAHGISSVQLDLLMQNKNR
jgi:hypothetical protein